MKRFVSPGALSVCGAVILLAGCGGSQSPISASGVSAAMPGTVRTRPASGGGFSGSYTGSASVRSCMFKQSGEFTFSGTGKVTFLHRSAESGELSRPWIINHCAGSWSGSDTLMSLSDPGNTITMSLTRVVKHNIIDPCSLKPYSYKVTGGTGKFAKATGGGTVRFSCHRSLHTYSDQWSGTLSF